MACCRLSPGQNVVETIKITIPGDVSPLQRHRFQHLVSTYLRMLGVTHKPMDEGDS